jgi:polysaccharide biosynthesis/export protein
MTLCPKISVHMRYPIALALLLCVTVMPSKAGAQSPASPAAYTIRATGSSSSARSNTLAPTSRPADNYILGPRDSLSIRIEHMDELGNKPYPIDLQGYLNLPRIGRVRAAGSTLDQLQEELIKRAKEYLQDPVVSIAIAEFRSQPITVLGAVKNPGVHQVQGNKTLYEVISESGGLRDDAGNIIKITRRIDAGPLPLPNAKTDSSGHFIIAQLDIRSVMAAKDPLDNIPIKADDVITVPKADLIYVIGCVKRPGGFPLQERASMSVLEALSLAAGLDHPAATSKSKILRTDEATHARVEIPIDVKKILAGQASDIPLLPNDILFIPTSTGKLAALRTVDTLIQTGTGVVIYGRPF